MTPELKNRWKDCIITILVLIVGVLGYRLSISETVIEQPPVEVIETPE